MTVNARIKRTIIIIGVILFMAMIYALPKMYYEIQDIKNAQNIILEYIGNSKGGENNPGYSE